MCGCLAKVSDPPKSDVTPLHVWEFRMAGRDEALVSDGKGELPGVRAREGGVSGSARPQKAAAPVQKQASTLNPKP